MLHPLIMKLDRAGSLTEADRDLLQKACGHTNRVGSDTDLVRQSERPDVVHVIIEGMAIRCKDHPTGRRQILAMLVPGDFCDLCGVILGRMDHGIRTSTPCKVAQIPLRSVRELIANHPTINHAFWWATLVEEATLREWILNMGQTAAAEQMAHFFCEMLMRLQTVGLAGTNSYELPLTQEEISQVLGVSQVHVNRTLGVLRDEELLDWHRACITIPDVPRLMAFCDFDPIYLHLEPKPVAQPF